MQVDWNDYFEKKKFLNFLGQKGPNHFGSLLAQIFSEFFSWSYSWKLTFVLLGSNFSGSMKREVVDWLVPILILFQQEERVANFLLNTFCIFFHRFDALDNQQRLVIVSFICRFISILMIKWNIFKEVF